MEKDFQKEIQNGAAKTADPERAARNLIRFAEANPGFTGISAHLSIAARLFAASQFLANYCIANPHELSAAIRERRKEITARSLHIRAKKELVISDDADIADMMKSLRLFKKRQLLRITIRDISGETDIRSSMDELTVLAETVIEAALKWSLQLNRRRYGEPEDSTVALIALGKLGGEELNYSSDIDLMAVYDQGEGQTSGVLNPANIRCNRVSNHEFFCKTIELFSKILTSQTEDGIAYRVDLRLRPQGQKGDIALSLRAYRTYYESWGRTWERMMLIRARFVAGDGKLGRKFMDMVRNFVWRVSLDFSEIEEIRGLKKKIDSTFSRDDIKRGYGGIREAEFFVQTFQLLFGGENRSLRSYRMLNAIQSLKWMKSIPEEDLTGLGDNYLYLRRVEHYLQMKEDLQTHTLPSAERDLAALALQMGETSGDDFLAHLRVRRMQIKSMYNSLLGTQEDVYNEALNLLEGGLKDNEITGYLSFRKVRHPAQGVQRLKNIKEGMRLFHTSHERSLSRKVVPQLLENALSSGDPDQAIAGIESLLTSFGLKTAHLMAFIEQKELLEGVVKIFSLSPYLGRIFLSSEQYINLLIEHWSIAKTLSDMEERLRHISDVRENLSSHLTAYKRFEEVRLGMLLLLDILSIDDLFTGLSQVAEAVIKAAVNSFKHTDISVIALGKLGGQEMTFGSDLDIIFVSEKDRATTAAEKIIKILTAYTHTGMLYSVDTRLRPDGSKGILVNTLEGYRNYYMSKAHPWEIQALLKARPVGGDPGVARAYMSMVRDVITRRGPEIRREDITSMRQRIIQELSQESGGADIKRGPGGLGEIEFYVQYLQLHHAAGVPGILIQNTLAALEGLEKNILITTSERDTLYTTYQYFSRLQSFLRLNEREVIPEHSDIADLAARFMGHADGDEFQDHISMLRKTVLDIISTEGWNTAINGRT